MRRSAVVLSGLLFLCATGTLAEAAPAAQAGRQGVSVAASQPKPMSIMTCEDVRAMMPNDVGLTEREALRLATSCVYEAMQWNQWFDWLRAQRAGSTDVR